MLVDKIGEVRCLGIARCIPVLHPYRSEAPFFTHTGPEALSSTPLHTLRPVLYSYRPEALSSTPTGPKALSSTPLRAPRPHPPHPYGPQGPVLHPYRP